MSGKGGLCYTLSIFNKFLLEALGYNVHLVGGDIGIPNNHVLTVVNDLKKPGDKYIVDVGFGVPNFEPIPVDFECESPVYAHSYSRVKYVREDSKLIRCHKKTFIHFPDGADSWRPICISDERLQPRQSSYFDEIMEKVYTDIDGAITPFCNSLRAITFRGDGANLKCLALKDSSLLLENESHDLEEVKLGSVEEILEKVDLHFPLLSDAARKAVKNVKFDF